MGGYPFGEGTEERSVAFTNHRNLVYKYTCSGQLSSAPMPASKSQKSVRWPTRCHSGEFLRSYNPSEMDTQTSSSQAPDRRPPAAYISRNSPCLQVYIFVTPPRPRPPC